MSRRPSSTAASSTSRRCAARTCVRTWSLADAVTPGGQRGWGDARRRGPRSAALSLSIGRSRRGVPTATAPRLGHTPRCRRRTSNPTLTPSSPPSRSNRGSQRRHAPRPELLSRSAVLTWAPELLDLPRPRPSPPCRSPEVRELSKFFGCAFVHPYPFTDSVW